MCETDRQTNKRTGSFVARMYVCKSFHKSNEIYSYLLLSIMNISICIRPKHSPDLDITSIPEYARRQTHWEEPILIVEHNLVPVYHLNQPLVEVFNQSAIMARGVQPKSNHGSNGRNDLFKQVISIP